MQHRDMAKQDLCHTRIQINKIYITPGHNEPIFVQYWDTAKQDLYNTGIQRNQIYVTPGHSETILCHTGIQLNKIYVTQGHSETRFVQHRDTSKQDLCHTGT